MTDLGQEALDEMNRLLLNQQRLKMKLERMVNYGESATIKKRDADDSKTIDQIADLSKKVERLEKQLAEANEVLKDTAHWATDETENQKKARDYLEKWGVK